MYPSRGSQEIWAGLTAGWSAVSYLVSGIVVWGGIGFWLDGRLGISPALTIAGMLIGNAAGVFLIYRGSVRAAEGSRHAS